MESCKIESALIGNGFNIQIGGDDYLNKWIVVRLPAKARTGEYDELFMDNKDNPIITGKEIILLFNGMVAIANDARKKRYDQVVKASNENDIIEALTDFKTRYPYEITSIEEIVVANTEALLLSTKRFSNISTWNGRNRNVSAVL
jgi:hypothetical protein